MTARALPLLALLPIALAVSTPAAAVTQTATVNANVVKPLTLTALQSLDLGTITLSLGTWSGATVRLTQSGAFTCPTNLICTGAPHVAAFNVTGTNKMVVLITAPDVIMVNQSDPTQKLTLALDKPAQVTLTSSGVPGNNFNVGGSLTLNSTTAAGVYSGTINVTVDYQ